MRKKKSNRDARLFIVEKRNGNWWLEIIEDSVYEVNDPKKATVCNYPEAVMLKMSLQQSTLYGVVPRYLRVPTYAEQIEEEHIISENNPFFKKKKERVIKEKIQENPFFKRKKKRFNDPLGLFK